MSNQAKRPDEVLPDAAARRLSNQIARAYRGTYGARTGLRTIVRSVARQMLHAGSPPDVVSRVIEGYVLNHPASLGADPISLMTGTLNSATLVELTQQCVADVLLEPVVGAKEIRRGTQSNILDGA